MGGRGGQSPGVSGMGVASAGTARSRLALRSAELALPEPGSVTPGSAPFGSGKGRGEKGKQRPGEPRRGGFGDKHGEFGGPVTPVAALGSPGGGSCPGGCTRAGSHRGTHARAHRGWCVTCGPCWVTPAPHSDGRGVGQEQEQPLPPPARCGGQDRGVGMGRGPEGGGHWAGTAGFHFRALALGCHQRYRKLGGFAKPLRSGDSTG